MSRKTEMELENHGICEHCSWPRQSKPGMGEAIVCAGCDRMRCPTCNRPEGHGRDIGRTCLGCGAWLPSLRTMEHRGDLSSPWE